MIWFTFEGFPNESVIELLNSEASQTSSETKESRYRLSGYYEKS